MLALGVCLDILDTAPSHPILKLSALDTLFAASGTAIVKVTRHGQEVTLELPIQSVDNEEVTGLAGNPPRVPRKPLGGGKFNDDVQDPDYQRALTEYNRKTLFLVACLGLALDVEDERQEVVWSADNSVRDLAKARLVLKRMGLVDNQLLAIVQAIRQLTQAVEEEASSD